MAIHNLDIKFTARDKVRPTLSEINVTPFVDVMLVLLVIFMIAAPLMQHGMDLKLPDAPAPAVEDKPIPTVSVRIDKKIYWDQEEVNGQAALAQRIKDYLGGDANKEIFFRADKALDYGYVTGVFAAIRNAGLQNIGMITEPVES